MIQMVIRNLGEKRHTFYHPGNDSIFPLFEWALAQERVFNHQVEVNMKVALVLKRAKI